MRQSYSQLVARMPARPFTVPASTRAGALRVIRRWIAFFMIALFLSGATAIPVGTELEWLLRQVPEYGALHSWLSRVLVAYNDAATRYSFLLYGYDWLAFAHFVLAILFIGPYRDPVRNIWVIEFGLIACALVLPFAAIAGHLRGIPVGWILIDCSFGIFGALPLWIVRRKIQTLSAPNHEAL